MLHLLCYVVMYYTVDKLTQHIYLPLFPCHNQTYLSSNTELYYFLKTTSYFMFLLFSYLLSRRFLSQTNNINSTGLIFIYIKYILDIIITPNMLLRDYEMGRCVMWVFTTPLMLEMFCKTNNLSFYEIGLHYHLFALIPHIFAVPFKGSVLYSLSTFVCSIQSGLFLNSLYKHKHLPFTNLYILMWSTFMFINILDNTGLCDASLIHAFYNLADTICKFVCNVVISNNNELEFIVQENMDLQSVHFVSHVVKSIKQFEIDNPRTTPVCYDLIQYYKHNFLNKIPETNEKLKLELLKKLLPFDLDKDYINRNCTGSGENKPFNMICVMFMDIMNYTELAKKHDGDVIFKLLDDIYFKFDNIVKKYTNLQKIETIGDAYMVVGDIFRNEFNHKVVVKQMILLGLEFIKEIKNVKTPDGIPLSIRVGINMGSVNIGILGNEIPRLCVVGNAVNVASRLQSTADIDTIQCSHHIYEQVEEGEFNFIIKEHIFLKNIGSVTTYSIASID